MEPGKVEVPSIEYPELRIPAPETNPFGGKDAPHGVTRKVVPTDIGGSDQHIVRGRTTAPRGSVSRMLPESDLAPRQTAPNRAWEKKPSVVCPTNIWLSVNAVNKFLRPARINPAIIRDLFTKPDAIESIPCKGDPDKKSIIIVERHFEAAKSHKRLLGIGYCNQRGDADVHAVLTIPVTLRGDVIAPLETLRRIVASELGSDVTIGTKTARLFVDECIDVGEKGTSLLQWSSRRSIHLASYVRVLKANDQTYAHCSLCFCLDMTRYLESVSH